jgi:hypothetical protein
MSKINVGRLILGGLAAGVVMFLADGFIHEVLLHQLWIDTMAAAGRSVAEDESHRARDMALFAAHEVLKGLALAWIYGAIRTRFGAGVKTAVLAGLTVWAIMFPVPFIAEIPTGFYGPRLVTMWSLYEIVPTVVGGLVAGFLYKEGSGASAPRP